MPHEFSSVQQIVEAVGTSLGESDWLEVTQDRINRIADATDDHQWIHVDVERARRESPFKATIAHGYLTLSLAPALLPQIVHIEGWETAINTGVEKLRFSAPVVAGSRVRLRAKIASARSLPRGGVRVTFALRFEVEGASRPACNANVTYVYYP